MKKVFMLALALVFATGSAAWAKPLARHSVKTKVYKLDAGVFQTSPNSLVDLIGDLSSVTQVDDMKLGLAYNMLMDIKLFNMTQADFSSTPSTSSQFFYSTYRALLSNVFSSTLAVLADIEKPGYTSATYPGLKVNQLYAKVKQGNLTVRVGREILGDTDDLFLGLQNDAITLGLDQGTLDLEFFLAKPELLMPWGGGLDGLIGFVPTYDLGNDMDVRGYVLIGTQSLTVLNAQRVNALFQVGGKYTWIKSMGENASLNLVGQLGGQFASAQTSAGANINANGLGVKADGIYTVQTSKTLAMRAGGHAIFTSGAQDANSTGFASLNGLEGSGPGLFNKIQDGAGLYTYLDSIGGVVGDKIRRMQGIFGFGLTGELSAGAWEPGLGVWFYGNTNKDGKLMGTEVDEWVNFKLNDMFSFYQQGGIFLPNAEGIGWTPGTPGPVPAIKLLVGTRLTI